MSVTIDPEVRALTHVDASEIQWQSTAAPIVESSTPPVVCYDTLSRVEILDYVVSLQEDVAIYRELAQRALAELVETQKALRNARLRIRDLESR